MLGVFPLDPLSPRGSLEVWKPLPSPSHPLGALVLSGLHFSSPLTPLHVLPCRSGVPPVSLGVKVPHQRLVGTLVVGRRELCVLPLHHLDTPKSLVCISYKQGHSSIYQQSNYQH